MRIRFLMFAMLATLWFWAIPPARAGSPVDDPTPKKDAASQPAKTKKKPLLLDAGRVSTDEAVRGAAKKQSGNDARDVKAEAQAADSDSVEEFHPAKAEEVPADAPSGDKQKTKKAPLKDIHGSVYGATSAGTSGNATGGEVGASSRSKKTHVYVQTDRTSTNPSH